MKHNSLIDQSLKQIGTFMKQYLKMNKFFMQFDEQNVVIKYYDLYLFQQIYI
ncbi:hypothetical protein pb186bvf_011579 [Paramecium bursaria]